jgi:DNA mismatch repair protein PMS2
MFHSSERLTLTALYFNLIQSNEKYTFENLMKNVEIHTQTLINPIPIKLASQLEYTAIINQDWIEANGFGLLIDEDAPPMERIHLKSVPQLRNLTLGVPDLEELIQKLSQGESRPRCKRLWTWYASKACRTSVMIGMALTKKKMERIVRCMAELEHPWNCPHGRPTMRHLVSLKEL